MHTLLDVCRTERDMGIPPGFFRNGWNYFLPMGMCSLLLSVVKYITQGASEKEISEKTNQEASRLLYAPFNFQFPAKFNSDEEKSVFCKVLERETRVSTILERTGIGYPKCIRHGIDLLLYSGILLRVGRNNMTYLDVVIEPFPFPENVLHLTSGEKYQIMKSRQHIKQQTK